MRECFLVVIGSVVLTLVIPTRADLLLRDEFNAPALNRDNWAVGTWTLGRTQLGNTPSIVAKTDTSPAYARLELDTFNPPNDPGKSPREHLLRGTEIFSNKSFSVTPAGVRFEAKVRNEGVLPPGLVTSFFTYMSYEIPTATFADEIDFEFLSNQLNAAHGPILCSTWHDFMKDSTDYSNARIYNSQYATRAQIAAPADLTKWTVYAIDWYPDRVEWRMDGQLVRTAKQAVPARPMSIRLNFWAPRADWAEAFNAEVQPTADPAHGKKFFYDVSDVQVSTLR